MQSSQRPSRDTNDDANNMTAVEDSATAAAAPSFRSPFDTMWGFHVHADVAPADFAHALLVQKGCLAALARSPFGPRDGGGVGAPVVANDAFRPGYGPHTKHMWEVRVEMPVSYGDSTSKTACLDADNEEEVAAAAAVAKQKRDLFVSNAARVMSHLGDAAVWLLGNHRGFGPYIHLIDHDEDASMETKKREGYF